MNPLISVAMATYNGELYIKSQLDSILNQTYQNIEIIIVDDCSTDNTVAIINDFQQKYLSIRLFKNSTNQGVVKTFERALSLCNGEYIALSDQDDVWFNNKLEVLFNNIGDNLLIHSDAVLVDDNMNIIANSNFKVSKKDANKSEFTDYLISNNVTGCTALFPKRLLSLALPIPNGFYIHDHYLAIIASFYGAITLLKQPLVYYRQHGSNSIGAKRQGFEHFKRHALVVADSYNLLLELPAFKNNFLIQLIHDYRCSIYYRKWSSKFSIFRLFQIKHGFKLMLYFILIGGVLGDTISKKIYNYLYKV